MTDTIDVIVDLLNNNWLSANTDSIVPSCTPVYDKKRVGGLGGEKTWIGIYLPEGAIETPIDLGYNFVDRLEKATIDIRTDQSYSHSIKVRDETKRIIRANRKPSTGFDTIIVRNIKDLSNPNLKGFWRWIIELDLQVLAEAVA